MKLDPRKLAKLLAGLQVPLSIGVPLGAAREPYLEICKDLGLRGWETEEGFLAKLEELK